MPSSRWHFVLVVLAVCVPILAPYATYRLPYDQSLPLQALAILLAVCALLLGAWPLTGIPSPSQRPVETSGAPEAESTGGGLITKARSRWNALWTLLYRRTARSLRWSLALYAAAALWAGAIGLASGHSLPRVAGQLLSMGLLPLAALAGLGLPRHQLRLGAGVVVLATGLPVLGHAIFSAFRVLATGEPQRLYLPGGVSVTASALLALTLVLAFADESHRLRRLGGWLIAALLLLSIAGSGVRGLWLVTVPTLILATLLAAPATARRRRMLGLGVAGLLGLAVAAGAWSAIQHRLHQPSTNLLPGRYGTTTLQRLPPAGLEWVSSPVPGAQLRKLATWSGSHSVNDGYGIPLPGPGLYRLSATAHAPAGAPGLLAARWHDVWGRPLRYPPPELVLQIPPGAGWRDVEAFALAPPGTASAQLRLGGTGDEDKPRLLRRVSLERIADPELGGVLVQGLYFRERLATIVNPFGAGSKAMRSSVSFRAEESRALLRAIRDAPWWRQLAGHGLGATFSIDTSVARPLSPLLDPNKLHYIHNFYLFLPFKLGLIFGLLAAWALVAWLPAGLRRQQRLPAGLDRRLCAAVLASWIGYLAWSLTSPEILSFRMAPLWGLMLALVARLSAGEDDSAEATSR
ncbi:MAG: hypothetical protein AAGD01_09490 [Acidobacteriota bacterium]